MKTNTASLLLVAVLVLAPWNRVAADPGDEPAPLVPQGAIPLPAVEGRLDHFAANVKSHILFISGLENHSVEVVDITKRERSRQLKGILEPQGLVYVPENRRLLVCSRGDGTCRSFDAESFVEGPWLDVGRNADNVRYNPASKTVFIGSAGEPGNGLVSAVELVSLIPAAQGGVPAAPHSPADFRLDQPRQADVAFELALPSHPESFQFDESAQRLFVNVPDEHEIAVLAISSNRLDQVASWPVSIAEKNFPMAYDAQSQRLFIACRKPGTLAVYDATSGHLVTHTPCVGDADDMFFDTKLRRLYVIGGEGFVDVFAWHPAGAELTRVAHVATAPRARTGLFVPEWKLLAVGVPHTTNQPAEVLLFGTQPGPE